jgi:gliding motility-associated-like protein
VVLTAIADNGCTDTARSPLIMLDGEPKPWTPSAFTPNNDGTNDLFKIYGIAIGVVDFRVYSRWGEMVFQTTDPKQGWDGTFLGMNSSTDVYVYEARIKMLSGKKYLLKGDVTLIR